MKQAFAKEGSDGREESKKTWGRHGKDKRDQMPKDGKRDEDGAGDGGKRKSIACGETLKPVHVRTRFPDL